MTGKLPKWIPGHSGRTSVTANSRSEAAERVADPPTTRTGEGPWLFSNSGREVKLSLNILAGSMVLSAVGACPPHDGVR